ncbi:inositol monophosphatase [Candidatus Schneideria nysicola]|uniref:inositol monophosphatase family protein n=1 Tax=Candidatus Schneideria nysicola TaxID=1081631 RepID=UPI001CAA462B|nr:inositol monophosphatase family protein [Candidatus Schneideria nysicola]UAJ64889.1 inositol monophosphatase [Candidatus Schneideria nysicola]UAJ65422.1 inositol monophosphatase [Candidatus Schneideria nysicola]
MSPILNIAIRTVRSAGNFLSRYYDSFKIERKNIEDSAHYISREVTKLMSQTIHRFYPQHLILDRVYPNPSSREKAIQWIINPIDNITNFFNGFPYFSISVAVYIKGQIEIAVIYDPIRNELFSAKRGCGAQLNGYRLRIGSAYSLNGAILSLGIKIDSKNPPQSQYNYWRILKKLFKQYVHFRYTGSITLDLAYVAAGRLDGVFQICQDLYNLYSGGELIVRESGGLTTDFYGKQAYLSSGHIISGNSRVVKLILANVQK